MNAETLQDAVSKVLGGGVGHWVTQDGQLRLAAPVDGLAFGDFLARGLDQPALALDWLPASVRLDRFELTPADASATIGASVSGAWSPLPGLTIEQVAVTLWLADGRLSGAFEGHARLDKLPTLALTVRLELPSQLFFVDLHADANLAHGAELFDHLGLAAPLPAAAPAESAHPPGPRLVDLSLSGSMLHGRYLLHLEAEELLHLRGLTIESVAVDLGFGVRTQVSVWATAKVQAGQQTIHFNLLGAIDPEGWRLYAAAQFDQRPTVDDFVRAIAHGAEVPRLPGFIGEMGIAEIDLSVDTVQHLVAFHCTLDWPDGPRLDVRLEHRAGALDASGVLHLGGVEFMVSFDHSGGGDMLVAAFSAPGGVEVGLGQLLAALGAESGPGTDALHLRLQDALVAYRRGTAGSAGGKARSSDVVIAADLGLGIDLAAFRGLPLVGSMLPPGDALKLAFGVGYSKWSGNASVDIPAAARPPALMLPTRPGMSFSAQLHTGDGVVPVAFPPVTPEEQTRPAPAPLSTSTAAAPLSTLAAPAAEAKAPALSWHAISRAFGPVHVERVGLGWDGATQEVVLALDASLALGGLTITLQGFGARYRLEDHHLALTLAGLGLDLRSGTVEIGGAFLHVDGDYVGSLTLRSGTLHVNALGAFTMLDGAPSMFAYAVVNEHIGGPSFFDVQGLAVGFAYNRELTPPTLEGVRSFPLVADAIAGAGGAAAPGGSPAQQLVRIHDFVRPALGQHFVAVGVKFTSFKLLDSFVLLIVSLGRRPEIDLIGTSTYQSPPGALGDLPALVQVGLDLVGRLPLDGELLQIEAKLTQGSYLYTPKCVLSGGFAFYSWFSGEHAGAFVLSIGGYHPDFDPALQNPRCPVVAPLAINFQVTPSVFIKGSAYLALTPSMIMAGCAVEAAASIGSLHAGFSVKLNFLMGWEPYHYAFDIAISIYASWGWFSTHASAALQIKGPEFGGTAHIDWSVFSFDVDFGASKLDGPVPISWQDFSDRFLPAADKVCTLQVAGGLVSTLPLRGGGTEAVINPALLAIGVSSVVPLSSAALVGGGGNVSEGQIDHALGIAPMNRIAKVSSHLEISVTRQADGAIVSDEFALEFVERSYPAALWGTVFQPPVPQRGQASASVVKAIGTLVLRPAEAVHRSAELPANIATAPADPAPARWPRRLPAREPSLHG